MSSLFTLFLWLSFAGSLLTLLVLVINKLLGKKLPRKLVCYLYLVVLLRFILPLGSPFHFPESDFEEYGTAQRPLSVQTVPPVPDTVGQETFTTPSVYGTTENTAKPTHTAEPLQSETVFAVGVEDKVQGEQRVNISLEKVRDTVLSLLPAVWLFGVMCVTVKNIVSYVSLKRNLARTSSPANACDLAVLRELYKGNRVKLYVSDMVPTALLTGVIFPAIYIPSEFSGSKHLRYMLMHELSHYRRCDVLYKLLLETVIAVHWFNPVVYLIRREVTHACELSCDESVTENMQIRERKAYSSMLLSCAESHSFACKFTANLSDCGKRDIKERLTEIMKVKNNSKNKRVLTVIIAVTLVFILAGCAMALGLPADEKKKTDKISDTTVENNSVINTTLQDDNATQTSPSSDDNIKEHEKLTEKPYGADVVFLKTEKDTYTTYEMLMGVKLSLDYELLAEYNVFNYPEDNNELRWATDETTSLIKSADGSSVLYPKEAQPAIAGVTYTADENAGAVLLCLNPEAAEDAEFVNASADIMQYGVTMIVTFKRDGDTWTRHTDKAAETVEREGFKEPEFSYITYVQTGVESTERKMLSGKEAMADEVTYDENGKSILTKHEAAIMAARALYNITGKNYDALSVRIGTSCGDGFAALYEKGYEDTNVPLFEITFETCNGKIKDMHLFLPYKELEARLTAEDISAPDGWKKMKPEKLAMWFYDRAMINNKYEIVNSEIVYRVNDHEDLVGSVILYTESGNSYEIDFYVVDDKYVMPSSAHFYMGRPNH